MVAMIMMRILHKDLTRYNELDQSEEAREVREETGWKLVFGDVFRPPKYAQLLAVYIGSGVQIFCMVLVTIAFAILGFLSPFNRGALMTAMVLLYVLLGGAAGFWSARFSKMFKCTDRKYNTLLTSFMVPGVVFFIFIILDLCMWGEKSTGAVPIGTIFALVVLWFGISVPLVFLGSYMGFRKDAIENPVRTNSIPRQIPDQVWYMRALPSILMGGILPFGAVFVELFFILNSIWQHRFYYLFGFLFLVFVILILTSAKSRSSCATSNCAQRTITGGGALTSRPAPRPSTSSCTRCTTGPQGPKVRTSSRGWRTSATSSSSRTSFSSSRASSASSLASGSSARSTLP